MARAASPRVAVSVIVAHDAWREAIEDPLPLLRRAAAAAFAEVRRARRSRATWTPVVDVALMDDRAIRKLNKTYRGKDKPTNVLSFPSGEATEGKRRRLGDVAIALGTVKREAKAQGKSVADHVAHLMVHAVLHLLGYDHEADPDAEEMEAIERKALAALGIADPYREAKEPQRQAPDMTDAPATRGARSEPQGPSERGEEAKSRKSLKNLFRLWRRRGGETDLRDAIEELIEESEEGEAGEAALDTSESDLLLNVLKFGELTAYDVMVPRADIKAVADDVDLRGLIQTVREFGHSRLPVYSENLDDIIGIVHIKDALPAIFEPEKFQLKRILREPVFVAPSVRLLDLLLQMRQVRAHMVLVVDEFGGTDGLVTIEDLVEQIIGEIEDEHDVVRGPYLVERPDGTLIANARTTISDFEERVGPILTEEEREADIDTLGGLVMSLTDRVPARGELVTHPSGIAFEVLDADPRRIKRLRVRNAPPKRERDKD